MNGQSISIGRNSRPAVRLRGQPSPRTLTGSQIRTPSLICPSIRTGAGGERRFSVILKPTVQSGWEKVIDSDALLFWASAESKTAPKYSLVLRSFFSRVTLCVLSAWLSFAYRPDVCACRQSGHFICLRPSWFWEATPCFSARKG